MPQEVAAAKPSSTLTKKLFEIFTEYRGVVMVGIVLPLSFAMELAGELRDWFFRTFQVAPQLHDKRVAEVQRQVKAWNASGQRGKKLMCTDRSPWLSMSVRTASFKADCNRIKCQLCDILELNEEKMTIRSEPMVNMRGMTQFLGPKGYQLAVQIEMEDITLGGVVMGCAIETNSHIFGSIHETIVAYDIVSADGELLHVTKENNPELFHALPWSHGTLGFLVAVELKVIPIKPYMHVTYIPCHTKADFCQKMQAYATADKPPSFLEATIYSKETSVIMIAEPTDADTAEKKQMIHGVNYFWKPWYYLHVETALSKGGFAELIPIRHYQHRFTRSVFWELRDMIPFGNDVWYRYLLGWLGAPKVSLMKLTMTPQIRREVIYKHVVQDMIVPMDNMSEAIDKFHEWFNIYPLLFFPVAVFDHGKHEGFIRNPPKCLPGKNYQMYFNLGAYGVPQLVREKQEWDAIRNLRAMEHYARDKGGYQLVYTDLFHTRDEFRSMFNHDLYDRMRAKYNALGAFPEVFDKVKPEKGLISEEMLKKIK